MVKSLEQYVSEATQAYQPAQTAVQNQLNALPGQLDTANEQINRNYAQQQAGLNRQRNMAAETASMQAAGSGGSFGGQANLANRKYYDQTFVPAVTQLRAGQANELAQARQASENQRTALNSQLSTLQAQANQQALAQYYNDQNLEKQLAEQRRATEAQNAYNQYLMEAMKQQQQQQANNATQYHLSSTQNQYGGYDWLDNNGNPHTAGTVAASLGGDFTSALAQTLAVPAQKDAYSANVLNEINQGYKFAKNNTGNKTGNAWYDTLGIIKTYDPYAQANTTKTNSVAKINPSQITRGFLQTNGRNK